ncbi:fimbrial protein [Citrobacter amalonaticus]|uniref:fimbrial protein n=1 Tax=Citrobacter amalonaticus TaxID=35703 RepID=UPI001A316213|nr:hypothetical protein [Citrobacter amalonaticus]HDQ2811742.1 hypothetical protein [Citrobacter amalonaticus]
MSFFKLVIVIFFFHVASTMGATENCEVTKNATQKSWSQIHVPFELKPTNVNVTVGDNIADWMVLYTIHANIGMANSGCNGNNTRMYFTILSNAQPISKQGSDYIYATDVLGIGMSVAWDQNAYTGVQTYPSIVLYGVPNLASLGDPFWATIKFWKIPNQNIPIAGGPITVTGPDAAVIYSNSGNTFTSSESERITSDGKGYINTSRILTGTLIFQSGTCNVEGDNVNVPMGEYAGTGGYSAWKDASFKLICPNGYGYQGNASSSNSKDYPYNLDPNATITQNNKQNGKVQISIVPLNNGAIDPNRGIIALDGTGAQGYGIQLAWGDYSTQNASEPVNPVILNSYVDAHSLNSAFSGDLTPLGGNGFTGGDNTIKMAARYIRTSGDTAPGPANAVVQVIANYQ